MQPVPLQSVAGIVRQSFWRFVRNFAAALPRVLAGLVFLVLAFAVVKVVMALVRATLRRALPDESPVYRQFVSTIVSVFLWFAVGLSFLSIVGLDGIAASLGTAAGFVALGVSYALSNVIADAVAGVYLLRDPDFMPGDTVDVGGTTGEVKSIELRKTRLSVEGDTVVRGNAAIEKEWRKLEGPNGPE
ncbi:mechanosensitive ion channel domain-containing protein [Candidatus Halobonum tyrrellensis]|uniref:mechanosensitive ion channel domain-containing protein n=1 Tax=Candidatus Halobonum tyrrellensis TaxID=1431545 RepID=UPI00190F59D4|nr:mechanosensitive ion channel domain-containing protein [Candidatus Halobonum tyrrellensis]